MDQLLGLLLLAVYITATVAFAAVITGAVIKIFPTERNPKGSETGEKSEKSDKPAKAESKNGGSAGGRLFRKSKRRGS